MVIYLSLAFSISDCKLKNIGWFIYYLFLMDVFILLLKIFRPESFIFFKKLKAYIRRIASWCRKSPWWMPTTSRRLTLEKLDHPNWVTMFLIKQHRLMFKSEMLLYLFIYLFIAFLFGLCDTCVIQESTSGLSKIGTIKRLSSFNEYEFDCFFSQAGARERVHGWA